MLRELQVTLNKPANTMFKSAETAKLVTGMGVVRNEATKTFGLPTAETAKNIYVLDKERIPKGANASFEGNLSDYHTDFVEIETGEFAKTINFYVGERFATDQYTKGSLAINDYVSVGTSGKWQKATASTLKSVYIYKGEYKDTNGTVLALIEVGTEGNN